MYNKSILSICIPTYNRGSMLEESIRNMVKVCEENNILIYVSDNASSDDTNERILRLLEEYNFIHYHRHSENIGSDDNFEFVLKMSTTKYRWLMSDTCYVNNIGTLVDELASEEWDGYVLNDPSTRAKFLPSVRTTYVDSRKMMSDIGWHLTWISCMIYNEKLIETFDFKRYKDSCFNQTALMFEPLANRSCKICFDANVIVWNLPLQKESGWHYEVFDVMYRKWYMVVFSLPLYYSYELKLKCYRDSSKYALPLQLYFHAKRRMEGKWKLKDLRNNRFFVKESDTSYCKLFIIGLCPPEVIRIFFFIGHYTNIVFRFVGLLK